MRPLLPRFFLGCLVLAFGGAGAAWADNPPAPIAPDRPGFTNGADVLLPGRTQAEFGITVTRVSASSGGAQTTDYPETLLRRGLTPTLELRVGLPNYFAPQRAVSGFGDASVGVKYKFYQSKNGATKMALTPALSLPVGSRDFSTGRLDPLLTFAAQTASGARWGISANLALADPTQNGQRIFHAAPSVSASYQMTPSLSGYAEIYDDVPRQGAPSPIFDGGFTYLLSANLQIDLETGAGAGGVAPNRFFGGGFALRF